MGAPFAPPEVRFWRHVVVVLDDCWWWIGCRTSLGYGRFSISTQRRAQYAHRFAYEMLRGPIPAGLTIDHLCRNSSCVNPAHLEAVTQGENVLRSPLSSSGANARKERCIRGHRFDRVKKDGGRACSQCDAIHYRARRERMETV